MTEKKHTLLRDRAIPAGVILPVSGTITSVRGFGHGYDRVLEAFSRPFMRRYDAAYPAQLVAHTIRHEMADEARVLVRLELAQQRIKDADNFTEIRRMG